MKENWLKDELYRRLSQKESSSDLDQLWQELEAKRYPRKKRRALWIWFIPILFVLISSFFLIYEYKFEATALSMASNAEKTLLETSKTANEEHVKPNESFTIRNVNPVDKDEVASSTEFLRHHKTEKNQKTIQLEKNEIADNQVKGEIKTELLSFNVFKDYNNRIDHFDSEFISISTTKKEVERSISLVAKIGHQILELKPPLRSWSVLPKVITLTPISSSKTLDIKRHMIGFSGSFGTMSSNLLSTSMNTTGIFTKEYYNERNRIEKNQDYLDLALNYTYSFQNNVSIHTGVSYQQYTSKYQDMIVDNFTENIIDTTEIYLSGGEIVDVQLGEIPITTTTLSRTTNFIKYRMLRVPILIGYEMYFNDKVSISLATGISLGFTMIGESRLPNPELFATNYLDLRSSKYTQSILFESASQINISRHFSNNWILSLGLKYNRDISNRLTKEVSAEHKLSSFNFMIGIGKRF